jgi:CubicO group peptidase (beta-lactamase class C family)
LAQALSSASASPQAFPPDSAVPRILQERVALGRNPGIVVGLLDERGARVVAAGVSGREGLPLDGNTLLEIGSATKVFTSVLLADMVTKGEVRLDEPVQDLLPAGARIPEKDGRRITLLDLATHRSGLPRLPSNFAPADLGNPYADYSPDRMLEFLAGYELHRTVGAEFEYSNLAVGLLGYALSVRAGKSYEELLRERILVPLGMTDTGIDLPPALEVRLAQGHTAAGTPTPNWDFTALAGAGAIRSTALDMLRFLAASLPGAATPLSAALDLTHQPRNQAMADHAMALGWLIFQKHPDRPLIWHNGGTGGYRFFMGVDQAGGRAVAVFTNAPVSADDLGFHLLDARNPLAPPERR